MRKFRYSPRALLPNYVRALTGFVIAGAVMLFAGPSSAILWIAGSIALLFLLFGLVTWVKQATVIEASVEGLRAIGPLGRAVPWNEMRRFELRYFSVKKDRGDGWMQMTVGGKKHSIRVESMIDGFSDLVAMTAREAGLQGIGLSEASRTNLEALGLGWNMEGGLGRRNG